MTSKTDTLNGEQIRIFSDYLRACTDEQVRGVWLKEKKAGRDAEAALCEIEATRRGLFWLD